MRLSRRACQVALATLIVQAALLAPATSYAARNHGRDTAKGIVVKLQPGTDPRAFALRNGLEIPAAADSIPAMAAYRFEISDRSTTRQKLIQLSKNTQVVYAEPNILGATPEARQRSSWVVGGTDADYAAQWAGGNIRIASAHTLSKGQGIIVAILDTGVDTAHPMLKDHLVAGYDFVDSDADPQEEGGPGANSAFGHGTHVAGLVALAAPEAKIMALRTLNPDGIGDLWTQARAIRYAAENGADVINLSYSFEQPSKLLDEALKQVTCIAGGIADCRSVLRAGVVVVAAAGNSGTRLREYPAAEGSPGILGVGANLANDTLAPFSTYGGWVQLMAPGDHILSTIPGGGYASWSGTSMSAPLAAGVAALVRAAYPSMRPDDVVVRLATTSFQTSSLVKRRLDAAAALGLAAKRR